MRAPGRFGQLHVALLLGLLLLGCGADESAPAEVTPAAELPTSQGRATELQSVRIEGVPHVVQKPLFCGEACAEMWLRKLGRDIDQDQVFARSGLDPSLGRGADTPGLRRALVALGFEVGEVEYRFMPAEAGEELRHQFSARHRDLLDGIPSIIKMRADPEEAESEHFRLILGYDAADDEVIYHKPGDADGAYSPIERQAFLDQWPLRSGEDEWTVIRLRMRGGS